MCEVLLKPHEDNLPAFLSASLLHLVLHLNKSDLPWKTYLKESECLALNQNMTEKWEGTSIKINEREWREVLEVNDENASGPDTFSESRPELP